MKKWFGLFSLLCVVLLSGCSSVPILGRKQVVLLPEQMMISQSITSYQGVLKESKLSTDQAQTAMIKRVGERISVAVEQYMQDQGMADRLDGYDWEFSLIEEDVPNAWCMPGGKVAFYTGILPFTKDEAGVAVVMGHEIAHAVARHGNERLTAQLVQQGGGALLSWSTKESEHREAWMMAYGLGSQYLGILPYSRMHENEADRLGLIFMAMAGYDPHASVEFWQRMAASNDGAPPEFLSTHPSDETRIKKLQEHISEAMQYYVSR